MTDERVLSIRIAASPEAAWAAITEPEQMRRWFPTVGALLEPKIR